MRLEAWYYIKSNRARVVIVGFTSGTHGVPIAIYYYTHIGGGQLHYDEVTCFEIYGEGGNEIYD